MGDKTGKYPSEYPKDGHMPELDVSGHKHGGGGAAQFCKCTLLCPSECSFYQSLFSQETKHKLVPFTKTTKYKE